MDVICGLVGKFCDLVIDQSWEQLLYLIYCHRNIDELNQQLVELDLERSSLRHQIDEAENNGDRIEDKVRYWLGEVDKLSEQVQKFHEKSQAKVECNITSCPNPWLRYKLSKRAKAMTEEAAKIYAKRNFDRIAYPVPLPAMVELCNREGNEGIDSRVPIMNQILEELGNRSVYMIGLCGLGGVGKTTLAIEVAKNQKIFEKVIMATISQELNVEKIQGEIAEKLSIQLTQNNTDVRAFRLCERLKQEKNMLLILDDLWEELDLGEVGVPRFSVEGCKILLTSRDKALLSDIMKCQKIVEVGVFSEDQALELFKKSAELSTDSRSPELISIATDIVRKCGGLPLAIVTVAKALRNKDIYEWQDALDRLNNPFRRNNTLTREVDTILKWSFDCLSSSEYKNIFLLTAMLSHDPLIEDLLMYSVGLDILDGIKNMEGARFAVSTIVRKLKSSNLFLDSISGHHFTMHDVFRDVALSIAASKESNAIIERYRRLNVWPDNPECCKGICLQECDIGDLPEELNGPILEFFLLNSKKSDLTIPNRFFKSSKKLKVLAITKVNFSSLPSLSLLQELKALCLHSCLLEDITEIRCLRKLKVLSLAYSKIERLPVEVAELTSLQMLNLSHCSKLEVIPQKLLSSLKKLEVLYMANSFNQWKVEGSGKAHENASLEELMNLPISSLEIHIPNLSMLPENLFLKINLRRYKIFIGERWTWWQSNYGASKILKLELESSIDLTARLRNLSKGVEDLHLCGSNGQENVLYNLDASEFPCLRDLRIESNHDIKYIILNSVHHEHAFAILESLELQNLKALENLCEGPNDIVFGQLHTLKMEKLPAFTGDFSIKDRGTENGSNKIFNSLFNKELLPKLEILKLSNLNSLIPLIWDDQLLHNSFNNLKTLTVKKCGFVKLISLPVLKSLNNLEELEVGDCDMLEAVFDFEDLNDYYKKMESSSVVVPLKKLKLWNLPKLKNVWSDHYQGNVSFRSLRSIDVYKCESLTSIFPASIAKDMLGDLEELQISCCSIDVIVANDQASESVATAFQFPRLSSFILHHLPKLTNFYPQTHTLEWPHLQQLSIKNCDKLEIFEKEVSSSLEIYEEEDTLNSKYPLFSQDKVLLPKLEVLELSNLNSLIPLIWDDQLLHNFFNNLKTLIVEKCGFVELVPLHVLKSLNNLEELDVEDCGMLEKVFDFEDLIDYYKEIETSSVVVPLKKLKLRNLPKLKNVWSDHYQGNVSFRSLRSIDVYECESLTSIFPVSIAKDMLGDLEELKISYCSIDVIVAKDQVSESVATALSIQECDELEIFEKEVSSSPEIYEEESTLNSKYPLFSTDKELLPKLEILKLSNLNSLIPLIWDNQLLHNSFNNLKTLTVEKCGFVKLIPLHVLKSLNNLEDLDVEDCDMLEKVFDFEDLNDYYKEMETSSVVVPLKQLRLWNLPKLKNIWSNNCQGNVSFPCLRRVDVYECESLTSIFPVSIAKGMLCDLEELQIDECGVDVIVAKDQVSESVIVTFGFPRLTSFMLCSLPKLINFYPQKHTIEWPHLNRLSIQYCDELEIFEKKVSSSLEIHEEENMSNSKYPLLTHDKVIGNLESLIFQGKGAKEIGSGQFLMYHFPKLKLLHLSLEEERFYTYQMRTSNLGELKFSGDFEKALGGDNVVALVALFPKLTLEKISIMRSLSPSLFSSSNLTHLNVIMCNEWTTLMTSSIARSLVHITHLSISGCYQIEEIITKQEGEDDEDKEIFFKKLEFLKLYCLPRLKRFCGYNYIFRFPLLKHVNITECP